MRRENLVSFSISIFRWLDSVITMSTISNNVNTQHSEALKNFAEYVDPCFKEVKRFF